MLKFFENLAHNKQFFSKAKIIFPLMDEKSIQRLSRDECIEKLKEIGQHGPGTLEEMKMKLRKFSLHPKLYQRLKLKAQRQCKFECSLDPSEVPTALQHSNGFLLLSFVHSGIRETKDKRKPLECCRTEKLLLSKLYMSNLEYL